MSLPSNDDERPTWTFLTNHAHVMNCIVSDPDTRLRDVAVRVGITERAAQLILADLVDAGYVTRTRIGRRNHYEIHPDLPLRHPIERDHQIGVLLDALGATPDPNHAKAQRARRPRAGRADPPAVKGMRKSHLR